MRPGPVRGRRRQSTGTGLAPFYGHARPLLPAAPETRALYLEQVRDPGPQRQGAAHQPLPRAALRFRAVERATAATWTPCAALHLRGLSAQMTSGWRPQAVTERASGGPGWLSLRLPLINPCAHAPCGRRVAGLASRTLVAPWGLAQLLSLSNY